MRTPSFALFFLCLVAACESPDGSTDKEGDWLVQQNFESFSVSGLPLGWRLGETNGRGLRASWGEVAGREGKGFGVTEARNVRNTYNLAVLDGVKLEDFRASFSLRAMSGEEDQGGGLVWRFQDFNNYYICRWNPLEDNLRFYKVVNGIRTMLATSKFRAHEKAWHLIQVQVQGKRVRILMDEDVKIDVEDETFRDAGQIGFWTKADAVTSFDQLYLR
jgi:hypothetical protein